VTITARIQEHGDHIYITTPVSLFSPDEAELEAMVFAKDLRSLAPNPKILWLKGQYVEADQANNNADQWTAGELAIKALTPVLMPITVMHDLRSAVGTIADAKLLTPQEHQVPRARIDTTLAVWAHRFPEVAAECRTNAAQSTLMQSMECLAPHYDCSVCGQMLTRDRHWERTWKQHIAAHSAEVLSGGRSPARILRNVTFTGVGLIFGTRGARGAMPDAHLEVDELAAMHREAHTPTSKRPRRKNTVDIDDSKYTEMVQAQAKADSTVAALQADVTAKDSRITELEAKLVKAEQERDEHKTRADNAEEASRVAAMAEERMAALGTGFMAKLSKMETTAKVVRKQAGEFKDEDWTARLAELEELLGVKRDAKADDKSGEGDGDKGGESTAGDKLPAGLFSREQVAASAVGTGTEVTAAESRGNTATEPTVERRQSVMGGLVRPRKPAPAAKS
jgi:hypothetical protein